MENNNFIVFEGGEGSGKTTQILKLKEYLESEGYDVVMTREPGGVPTSESIREIILNQNIEPVTEALLFAGARKEHLAKKVVPALKEGKIVLCDRFLFSSLAYQGYARDLGIEEVYNINKPAIGDVIPGLTLFLDLEPEIGIERILSNRADEINRLDKESIEFHKKVRKGYENAIAAYPEYKSKKIDASQDMEKIAQDIRESISEYLSTKA
jgi:dTMP kinase